MTQEELARFLAMEPDKGSEMDSLDDREVEFISLMADGNGGNQIAREMALEPPDLAALKQQLMKKLKLKNEIQLVQFAARQKS